MSWNFDQVSLAHFSPRQLAKLKAVRVGIAGAGGLGSNVAMLLVRSGVEQLTIIDHDVVSVSNLNRQAYWPEHLNSPKVRALAEQLLELNPMLKLSLHQTYLDKDNILSLLGDCPLVIEALDVATSKKLLIDILLPAGQQLIAASGIAGWGGAAMQVKKLGKLTIVGDFKTEFSTTNPVLAPRVTLAAAMQADCALQWILQDL